MKGENRLAAVLYFSRQLASQFYGCPGRCGHGYTGTKAVFRERRWCASTLLPLISFCL